MNYQHKPVIFSKQIHSCLASCSSNDVFLNCQLSFETLDFNLVEGQEIKSDKYKMLAGETISQIVENIFLIQVYLEPDKTFYTTRASFDTTVFSNIVGVHLKKGWTTEQNYLAIKTSGQQEYLEGELRKFQGYVIPNWERDLPVESYRGALSKEVFEDKKLQNYLAGGGCHGYIGHSGRTFETDRELEKVAKEKGASNEQISYFLSHSAGRHYADQLSSKEDVEKYFSEYFVWDKN